MQEVDDEEVASEAQPPHGLPGPEASSPEEAAQPEAALPPPPPELQRSVCKMREKVPCPDCGKQVSYHTLNYGSHKKTCKGKKKALAEVPETPETLETETPLPEKPKRKPRAEQKIPQKQVEKPPLSQKQVEKPLKSKQVIQRTPAPEPFENPFLPQRSWYENMVHMRNQQAMARNEAMLAPYQALFAARGARNNLHFQR